MKKVFARQLIKHIKRADRKSAIDLIYHDPNERNPNGSGWTMDGRVNEQFPTRIFSIVDAKFEGLRLKAI